MRISPPWNRIIWGPITATAATVGLAVLGFSDGDNRPWPLIACIASFLVLHSLVNSVARRNLVTRLGGRYADLQRRVLQLVSDLSSLGKNQYDLWMVDLYLHRRVYHWTSSWPFLLRRGELSRELSVSLLEVSDEPTEVNLDSGIYAACFEGSRSLYWFNEDELSPSGGTGSTNDRNLWRSLSEQENSEAASRYGLLTTAPIVNQLGKKCIGVLAVHVKPERHKSFEAHSVIMSDEGRRDIHNACVELHGLLSR